jgi:hypothetical protein
MARSAPSDISWLEGWEKTASTGRNRREAERLMAYWEGKLEELGGAVTIAGLDLAVADSREWSNRFLISVDPVVERSALLLYGPKFAQLMGLRAKPRTDLPMMRQLPRRYGELFLRGCTEAQQEKAPVRLEGEIERADGRIEQYRAIFIPVGVKPNSLTSFAFGAFNSRVLEPR